MVVWRQFNVSGWRWRKETAHLSASLRSVEKHFQEGHQHRDLSTALRFGRDDKGEGGASMESSCPKMMTKTSFCSAVPLSGSTALPFVISTGAQRSGEISVWMLFLGNVFLAGGSLVKGPAVAFLRGPNFFRNY